MSACAVGFTLGREATICRDRSRKFAKYGRQPAPRLGIIGVGRVRLRTS